MKTKPKTAKNWYNQRKKAIALALLALVLAYFVGSRALDTGSLLQYAVATGLIIFAIVRMGKRGNVKGVKE
jgi:hypothetical protein